MARHGGFGGGGGGAATSHVSSGAAALLLILFGATLRQFVRTPKFLLRVVGVSLVLAPLMLLNGTDNVLDSPWLCWVVLGTGWWLSDHLRKEEAARKERASTEKGVRK